MEYYILNNGTKIPYVGLGTFKLRNGDDDDEQVSCVLDAAISCGYRLIDTASCYGNEKDIGSALQQLYKKHGLSRSDFYITSKLAPKHMDYDSAISTCTKTLEDLQTDYIDCYLIHWPARGGLKPEDEAHGQYRKDVWFAFQDLLKKGCTRSIGVSNFTKKHLEELLTYAEVKPVLNQEKGTSQDVDVKNKVEFHPHLHQTDLLKFCQDNNIFLQAYSSLATGQLLPNEIVSSIGHVYQKTNAQILLKWALQQNVGVLPKSINPEHIHSNFTLFDFKLSEEHMKTLTAMDIQKHYCWDPNKVK